MFAAPVLASPEDGKAVARRAPGAFPFVARLDAQGWHLYAILLWSRVSDGEGREPPAFSEEAGGARMPGMAKYNVRQRLALRRSGIHGKGVFAREPIPAGTRLIEYTGERVTQEEGDRRYPWIDSVPYHTLLFTIEDDLVVDGGVGGNMSRYINHSCDPNCTSVIEDRRIYIESLRDIQPGEEITFDYQMITGGRHTAAEKRRFPCRCGAAGCRGTMLKKKR